MLPTTRRQVLLGALPAALGLSGFRRLGSASSTREAPVRALTGGPKHHWFGYYDKHEFDPTGRYVLGMEVDFEGRSPRPEDVIAVGMVDRVAGDRWIELGTSRAWCWQQGCMLQWRPGSRTEVLWNDREGDRYVCRILDVETKRRRTIQAPIYAVAPDGRSAIAADFRRLQDLRPGYGYPGIPDPFADELAPEGSGIERIDLETGESESILSIAEVARFESSGDDVEGAKHWFNHLLFNPDGSRFAFLHRWRSGRDGGFRTRMLTARPDGTGLFVLDPSGHTSHFIWRDPRHVLAWTRPEGHPDGFYLFEDEARASEPIGRGVMTENGHCTYLPGNKWILNDTYPDANRLQHVYLYHVETGRRVPLGDFHSPPSYAGEWRCDTHPRPGPDGKVVVIDSPHDGGRQLYLIDIGAIVG